MSSLSNEQKRLLFDYCLGLTLPEETAEAKTLISSDKDAAQLHSKLKASLSPLESLQGERCPDELAQRTVERLGNCARSTHLQLQQLITAEQAKTAPTTNRAWWSLGRIAAAAAMFLIVAAITFPTIRRVRENHRITLCQAGLARIWHGMEQYKHEHDERMPAVAIPAGAPWWKVGYQGKENHSASRSMWLLVKGNYAKPADFICPGKKRTLEIAADDLEVDNYNDFPGRNYILYSIRIRCNKSSSPQARSRKVLIADLSPLFENLPNDFDKPFTLELDQKLFRSNSINHSRRGQNVLFCDGTVKFMKHRHIKITNDDIFTLQSMCIGGRIQGCEVPDCESDTFLAP
jgi:hypothetical protein